MDPQRDQARRERQAAGAIAQSRFARNDADPEGLLAIAGRRHRARRFTRHFLWILEPGERCDDVLAGVIWDRLGASFGRFRCREIRFLIRSRDGHPSGASAIKCGYAPDTAVDVKALRGQPNSFRVRKGDWRLVFTIADDVLAIVRIAPSAKGHGMGGPPKKELKKMRRAMRLGCKCLESRCFRPLTAVFWLHKRLLFPLKWAFLGPI